MKSSSKSSENKPQAQAHTANNGKKNIVETNAEQGKRHLEKARETLSKLISDKRITEEGKARLGEEFRQLQRLLDKLDRGHIYIAAFGRVSVGKSALLNALAGEEIFSVSVLNGHTKQSAHTLWQTFDSGGVFLIDTPGIDEIDGKERAQIAEEVAKNADIILFVVDGDMTDIELDALQSLYENSRPIVLVLNKADRYGARECSELLMHLQSRAKDLIGANSVIAAAALPEKQLQIIELPDGGEEERYFSPPPQVEELRRALWQILQTGGQSYAALNAGIFAGRLSEKIGAEIVRAKKSIADGIIRYYALIKAVGVTVNPIPAVDLLALAADSAMIFHLSKVYGIEMTKNEAGTLLRTIAVQTGVLMGTVYGVHILSSVLKGLSGGLSTIFTAGAQGGVAFYGSTVIGKAAEKYFEQGASWGTGGAKELINEIIKDLDKQSLMEEAKTALKQIMKK